MSERRIKLEKGSILAVAIFLISEGVSLVARGQVIDGLVCIVVGLAILFLREHLKFHRWESSTFWRGKEIKA